MDGFTTRLRDNWLAATLFLAAAVVLAVGLGWTMARSAPDRPVVTANATTEITPGPDAPTPSAAGLGRVDPPAPPAEPAPPPPPAPGDGGDDSDGQPDHAAPSEPPAWPEAGPRVEDFRVAQQPLCPGGTTEYPIEGQPVWLEWRVTGTDTVTISIDGPGAYGSYPADGGAELPFSCTGNEGDIQEHAYHLTAVADGVTVTETIVVTAEVHEVADV
jgi:hypothetical protein